MRLRSLAGSGDFPHMLFYGPSGAGKKTRIGCTLRELFGPGAEKLKLDQRVFLTPSKRKLDLNVVQSNFHIEITPSDVGMYDRVVISEILKEIAQTQQVDLNAKQRFKVVVINEADSLTRDAQAALRRTMERYMNNLRIIMCANGTSKLIAPIKSRCLLVRVAAPSDPDMELALRAVAKRERFDIPDEATARIIQDAKGQSPKSDIGAGGYENAVPGFKCDYANREARLGDILPQGRGLDTSGTVAGTCYGSSGQGLRIAISLHTPHGYHEDNHGEVTGGG
ncbi:Replication factor C subunit 5 OS=Neurospora crassa (strain ATCC 24698 / 74-OR23-1A / CBS 708,71 / DSM 1257 / FGSC 987) GN=B14D6.460 PE=3 SV=1 [Rhizoctonia solani AG-1 IB]|uniref:Replication factor C subunit 5 n=1 Tax=Thanatephorus cucumeris (strain AG1-IB / isolate 7/3/14) TaxID=1108050 RepID=A0A0B7FIE8_THACB|nr:Replication factor C subunit 5 OS=Neurospora crassa (strain ATCC 24698 / 74-OR23-1A / CBS 708,71 / DSM 1257 / FGSC 987) GN=B14D6.460 PE=3 SV=1 [Rhizoctonia solani AG-1 IB]